MSFPEELVVGATWCEPTALGLLPHRLPSRDVRRLHEQQITVVDAEPAGVRIEFETDARRVELVVHALKRTVSGMVPSASGAFDLTWRPVGERTWRDAGSRTTRRGARFQVGEAGGEPLLVPGEDEALVWDELPEGPKQVQVWLPHDEQVRLVALDAGQVRPMPAQGRRVWLHHGSSISHGFNARRPTGTWVGRTAVDHDLALVNRGVAGSAMCDPFMARHLRDTPADLVSIKLGINIVNGDVMRTRAFVPALHGFLDTVREGHPTTPLLLVSPLFCPLHEDAPGPGGLDPADMERGVMTFVLDPAVDQSLTHGRLTLRRVRDLMAQVLADRSDDPNLYGLDGQALYGPADHEQYPMPDGLHPEPEAHLLISRHFGEQVLAPGRPFAATP